MNKLGRNDILLGTLILLITFLPLAFIIFEVVAGNMEAIND